MNILKNLLDNNRAVEVKNLLDKILQSYKSNSEIVDHIHIEQNSLNKYKENLSFNKNQDNKVVKIIPPWIMGIKVVASRLLNK